MSSSVESSSVRSYVAIDRYTDSLSLVGRCAFRFFTVNASKLHRLVDISFFSAARNVITFYTLRHPTSEITPPRGILVVHYISSMLYIMCMDREILSTWYMLLIRINYLAHFYEPRACVC